LEIQNGNLFDSLYGDDLRLGQIINNVLSNAFKYTHEGTVTMKVSCQREDDKNVTLLFSVSDTGIGIRKEDITKLFQDYNQVDTAANRHIEGTGLGLSITKGLINIIGGEISVESEYGKGTTFYVKLNQGFVNDEYISAETYEALRNLRYTNKKDTVKKLERPNLSHVSVLVVDDHVPNLDVAKWMLGKYSMKVDCATSGQEAIEKVKQEKYDAVFMDYMMPGMDGIETTRRIRAIDSEYIRNLPIIALTADAVVGNEQIFLEAGFQVYLTKPISVLKMDSVVQEWIINRANHQDGGTDVKGINVKYALSLYDGDMEMLLDIMDSFTEDIPEELEKLREVSEETLRDFAINVHTIKGCAAGIGALELSEKAKHLEQMAKSKNLSGVLEEKDEFIKSAYALAKDIRAWLEIAK
jgi:CheY-like chemotaxis protein